MAKLLSSIKIYIHNTVDIFTEAPVTSAVLEEQRHQKLCCTQAKCHKNPLFINEIQSSAVPLSSHNLATPF